MSNANFTSCLSCGAPINLYSITNNIQCVYCRTNYKILVIDNIIKLVGVSDDSADNINEVYLENNNLFESKIELDKANLPEVLIAQKSGYPLPPENAKNKPKRKNIVVTLFLILVISCLCFFVIVGLSKNNSSSSTDKDTISSNKSGNVLLQTSTSTSTFTPTNTPTPYFIKLPYTIESSEGWNFTVTNVEILKTLQGEKPKANYFLVIFLDVQNDSGSSDCLKMNEFTASDGSTKIEMEYYGLDLAHEVYSLDYPGAILGQCVNNGEKEKSILVFDIPIIDNEWTVNIQGKSVQIGKTDTILNPPPTATPFPSTTPLPTSTPTITPTSLPSGKISSPLGNFINVRSGPSVNFSVAFQLEGQTEISILNRNEQGDWYLIKTSKGERGWVRNDLLESTVAPTLLPISTEIFPTLTPSQTSTITPRPTIPYSQQAPKGSWCAQNNTRGVCVGNLEYRSYIGYTSASSEGRFITMAISIKNIRSYDISVSPLDFTLVMEDGRTYEYASETFYFNNALQSVIVAPGNSASGGIVFYVPNSVGPRKIICRGGFIESSITIDLYDKPVN
jgi:SH3-like domain-containing protein